MVYCSIALCCVTYHVITVDIIGQINNVHVDGLDLFWMMVRVTRVSTTVRDIPEQ